ncbi:hypothetical protein C7E17_24420, partial [Stenotrophomonas maltophilia]
AALENMSQGISVVDAQLQLVAWNSRYAALFKFPPELLQVGQPVVNLTAWALGQLKIGDAALQPATARAALENMSQGISVVDAQLQLVAWNSRYAALFKFP